MLVIDLFDVLKLEGRSLIFTKVICPDSTALNHSIIQCHGTATIFSLVTRTMATAAST